MRFSCRSAPLIAALALGAAALGAQEAKAELQLTAPLSSKLLGKAELAEDEAIVALMASKDGSAFSLVTKVQEGLLQKRDSYYLRQGDKKLGPFEYWWEEGAGSWAAVDAAGRRYAGTAASSVGPFESGGMMDVRSAGDRRVVFLADVGDVDYVQDGAKRLGPYEWVSGLSVAPVTGSLAYFVGKAEKTYLVMDAATFGPYEGSGDLLWSLDGTTLAYAAETPEGYYVFYGKDKSGPYKEVTGLSFAPDGTTLVYEADSRIYSGKEKLGPFDGSVSNVVFSPNGKRFAFTVYKDPIGNTVKLDSGESYGPFAWEGLNYSFSPDSKTFFCSGLDSKDYRLVVYMGTERRVIDKKWANPAIPIFSKDGRYSAFIADLDWDKWDIRTADGSAPIAPGLSCALLADGSPLYWTLREGAYRLVKAGVESAPYAMVSEAGDAKTLRWAAYRQGSVYLISCER